MNREQADEVIGMRKTLQRMRPGTMALSAVAALGLGLSTPALGAQHALTEHGEQPYAGEDIEEQAQRNAPEVLTPTDKGEPEALTEHGKQPRTGEAAGDLGELATPSEGEPEALTEHGSQPQLGE